MSIFQSTPVLNRLSKSNAFVQKSKNEVFQKFVFSPNEIEKKRANSNLVLPHHYRFEAGDLLAAEAPGVLGSRAPCSVPTSLDWEKNNLVLNKTE